MSEAAAEVKFYRLLTDEENANNIRPLIGKRVLMPDRVVLVVNVAKSREHDVGIYVVTVRDLLGSK